MSEQSLIELTVPTQANGENALAFMEIDNDENPTGLRTSLSGVEFLPLSYEDLAGTKAADAVTITLRWKDARVVDHSLPEVPASGLVSSGYVTIESFYKCKSLGLIKGGWLPPGLALHSGTIVLPDRCTISEMKARFANGVKKKADEDKDFLDFFADKEVSINPMLFALESNQQGRQSPETVALQLEEAYTKLGAILPKAKLVPEFPSGLPGIIGLLRDTEASMASMRAFLMSLAPKLRAPIAASRRANLWDEVLAQATACGVSHQSVVVFAVLSAIMVPNSGGPAKRVLKLTEETYSEEIAYNALADLRALEVLMSLFARFPSERLMLCTDDRNLALFWAGIRAHEFAWQDGRATYRIAPVEALLPGLSPEQEASIFSPNS